MAGAALFVLDAWLRPVPVGVVGELYVAGLGVGVGYVGRAGLTGSRFVACPFAGADGRDDVCCRRRRDWCAGALMGSCGMRGLADDQVEVRGSASISARSAQPWPVPECGAVDGDRP